MFFFNLQVMVAYHKSELYIYSINHFTLQSKIDKKISYIVPQKINVIYNFSHANIFKQNKKWWIWRVLNLKTRKCSNLLSFQCSFMPKFTIYIETKYADDNGCSKNVGHLLNTSNLISYVVWNISCFDHPAETCEILICHSIL